MRWLRRIGLMVLAGATWLYIAPHDPTFAAVLVVFIFVAYAYWRTGQGPDDRWLRLKPEQLDELTGVEFEKWLIAVLNKEGFSPAPTSATGDFGVDVVAEYRGKKFGVQAKKRKGKNIGNAAVQQVNAGCDFYGCELAVVVTQSRFTAAARTQAERLLRPCLLIGRDELSDIGTHFKAMAEASARGA